MIEHQITVGPGHLGEDAIPVHRQVTARYRLCSYGCQQEYLTRKLLEHASVIATEPGVGLAGTMLLVGGQVVAFGPAKPAGGPDRCAWCRTPLGDEQTTAVR